MKKHYETFLARQEFRFVGFVGGILLACGIEVRGNVEWRGDHDMFPLPYLTAIVLLLLIGLPIAIITTIVNPYIGSGFDIATKDISGWLEQKIQKHSFKRKTQYEEQYLYYKMMFKSSKLVCKYFRNQCSPNIEEDIAWLENKMSDTKINYLVCKLAGI